MPMPARILSQVMMGDRGGGDECWKEGVFSGGLDELGGGDSED